MKRPKEQLEKPEAHTRTPTYSYTECKDYLEKKYGYDERDYAKTHDHFHEYQEKTGDKAPVGGKYPDYGGPDGAIRVLEKGRRGWKLVPGDKKTYDAQFKEIHDHYKRYREWEKDNPVPEYQDFWHWVCDNCEVHNGGTVWFSRETLEYELKHKLIKPWQAEIYKRYLDEFANKKGELEMETFW